jgi:hypothetical protein
VQIDDLRNKADKLLTELVKNPEILEALVKGIESIKSGKGFSFNEQK